MIYTRDEDNTHKPKPKPEDFGWHESIDDDYCGWVFECCEEDYLEALQKWKQSVR